jgi:hypothetical protein
MDFKGRTYGVLLLLALTVPAGALLGQDRGPAAKWAFDEGSGTMTSESVSGSQDKIEGYYKFVPGVSGTALRLDGYTTSVTAKGISLHLGDSFSVSAWVALNAYPWNWAPIVDQEADQLAGYFFGIDAFGRLGLQVDVDGKWDSLTSDAQLPLKKWAFVVGTFSNTEGLSIYIDGRKAGNFATRGSMAPAKGVDILIGRVREDTLPAEWIHPKFAVRYSLDGILDEVEIFTRSLSAEEIMTAHSAANAPTGEVLPWTPMPSGPPGAGRFGAYYATLKFEDMWEMPRRIGPDSDVVVRFDVSPIRLVFWQGANYIPAWVTEKDKWYTDEFLETGGPGCPPGGDCEPMSDKQSKYSHVRVIESNDARAVVHWRYADAEVEQSIGAWPDPYTGWFDWIDEYYTVYPDGVAVRKQVLWSSALDKGHEWQETIVMNQPGTRPEDNINVDALTIANMKGETATYSWSPDAPKTFDKPEGPNIQVVNLKSDWKPFQIVAPAHSRMKPYTGEKTYSMFEWWNHWPVAQIKSSGISAVAPDRASHSSLSHLFWDPYAQTGDSMTKIMLDGLTTKRAAELVPLAKSWLSPPKLTLAGAAFHNEGYDPAQRAYVITRQPGSGAAGLQATLTASEESPAVNPAIVVQNWGTEGVRVRIDGKSVAAGKDVRLGHSDTLEGTDLIVWMRRESTGPVRISLEPVP